MTTTRPRPRWQTCAVAAAAVIALLVLSAVALNRAPAPASTGTDSASRTSGPTVRLDSTAGQTLTVPGEKPTVLFFMASWCATCIEQARSMTALEDDFADTATFVAVETTPNAAPEDITRFQAAADNPNHPYVVDGRGELVERYEVTALDTTVVLGTEGEVLARVEGRALDQNALKALLGKALP